MKKNLFPLFLSLLGLVGLFANFAEAKRPPVYTPCGNQFCPSGGGTPLDPGQIFPGGGVVPGIQP